MKFRKINHLDFVKELKEQVSRMNSDSSIYKIPLIESELVWLRHSLEHPLVNSFLDNKTLTKLKDYLCEKETIDLSSWVIEKQKINHLEMHFISRDQLSLISEAVCTRRVILFQDQQEEEIIPFKIVFNSSRKYWELIAAKINEENRIFFYNIVLNQNIQFRLTNKSVNEDVWRNIEDQFKSDFIEVILEVNIDAIENNDSRLEEHYFRLIYAFAGYDRELQFLENRSLRIHLHCRITDQNDLIQRILMLGNKIKIISPSNLVNKLLQIVQQTTLRYR